VRQRNRLHIYKRPCCGHLTEGWRYGPRYEPLNWAPFAPQGWARLPPRRESPSSPVAGLTCQCIFDWHVYAGTTVDSVELGLIGWRWRSGPSFQAMQATACGNLSAAACAATFGGLPGAAGALHLPGGLTLTCLASNPASRVITAHCDAGVLVGHGHARLLPARARGQLWQPFAGRVVALARAHHRRLRTLDQQRAQVVVAPLGDTPQAGLAAAGVLARHEA